MIAAPPIPRPFNCYQCHATYTYVEYLSLFGRCCGKACIGYLGRVS
jgi:hypothetical protein